MRKSEAFIFMKVCSFFEIYGTKDNKNIKKIEDSHKSWHKKTKVIKIRNRFFKQKYKIAPKKNRNNM